MPTATTANSPRDNPAGVASFVYDGVGVLLAVLGPCGTAVADPAPEVINGAVDVPEAVVAVELAVPLTPAVAPPVGSPAETAVPVPASVVELSAAQIFGGIVAKTKRGCQLNETY